MVSLDGHRVDGAPCACEELPDGGLGQELPPVEDGDGVADPLDVVEDVG